MAPHKNRIRIPNPPPALLALLRASQTIARSVLRRDGARPVHV